MSLSDGELERYADQLALPGFGASAQERLAGAAAIVVGAGGLGVPAAAYLATAGVGRVGVVDHAPVELTGLSRQALHVTPEVGVNRAESLALKLGMLNSDVQVEPYPVRLEEMNAAPIVMGADIVLEASNDSATRALVNDACCAEAIPFVSGGDQGLGGFATSVRPGESACLRCAGIVSAALEPPMAGRGALGAVAGLVGTIQAIEGLKLLTGLGDPLLDRVLWLDAAAPSVSTGAVARAEGCPACAGTTSPQQST